MKERIIKIAGDIIQEQKSTKTESQSPDSESIDNFLKSIEKTSPTTSTSISPHKLQRIGTFHSIFLKILKEDVEKLGRKYTKNFGIFDTNETQSVIKDVLKRMNIQDVYKVNEVKNFISTQKNN